MKLKEILPRWILRERAYGEIDLGGSAFAHLTEDADGNLLSDTILRVGDPNFGYVENYAQIDTGKVEFGHGAVGEVILTSALLADSGGRYQKHADGSDHWADGTNDFDVHLFRDSAGALAVAGAVGSGPYLTLVAGSQAALALGDDSGEARIYRATDGQIVLHDPNGLYASADDPGDDTGHGTFYGVDGPYAYAASDADPHGRFLTSAKDGGDGSGWFNISRNGDHHWGDGVTAPGVVLGRNGNDNLELQGPGQPGFTSRNGFLASPDGDTAGTTYVSVHADGSVDLSNGAGVCSLSTDATGHLLVNGVAVTVP